MSNRREQIEAAAVRAIKRGGLHSVSFRTLAEEVGVKSASVHYHFPTKDDLAKALVSDYTAQFQVELTEIGAKGNSLTYKLERLVDLFEARLRDKDLCLCAMMAAELTALNDQTRRELTAFVATAEDWLERQFEQHSEELALDLTASQFAQLFLASLEGALLFDRIDGDSVRLGAVRAFVKALTG
ncbi:MAG: TetR/AcrR family transcriptional regulator [Pseudomonadota bacterium]